ncbi:hypothetical protein DMC30DRAFT_86992 [Rhodotorula diobovata]|uniref:Essential protein Yae1 N-terminal domain-containing protein n=1 Tax=Rhodotorula diobovata TaxID=5288 RepID=A0A5C5G1L6_9BASI|nr:hypothetical protein DMC30DRAFT_86992 [Rhodotorula diobovata]
MNDDTQHLDGVLDLERDFYDQGLASGLPHGHLHGLIEGRELGRDHAWTLWDEIGHLEGTALLWRAILDAAQAPKAPLAAGSSTSTTSRASSTLDSVLALVDAFPTTNNSSEGEATHVTTEGVDMTAQLSTLRTKYRTACAALGIRPRMAVSSATNANAGGGGDADQGGVDSLKSMGMSV